MKGSAAGFQPATTTRVARSAISATSRQGPSQIASTFLRGGWPSQTGGGAMESRSNWRAVELVAAIAASSRPIKTCVPLTSKAKSDRAPSDIVATVAIAAIPRNTNRNARSRRVKIPFISRDETLSPRPSLRSKVASVAISKATAAIAMMKSPEDGPWRDSMEPEATVGGFQRHENAQANGLAIKSPSPGRSEHQCHEEPADGNGEINRYRRGHRAADAREPGGHREPEARDRVHRAEYVEDQDQDIGPSLGLVVSQPEGNNHRQYGKQRYGAVGAEPLAQDDLRGSKSSSSRAGRDYRGPAPRRARRPR